MSYYRDQFIQDYSDREDTSLYSDDEIEQHAMECNELPDEQELEF